MVEIDINKHIASKSEEIFLSLFGIDSGVFSVDTVKEILNEYQEEEEFKFNIRCDGGSVSEGLAIYDILRQSGKNIHMNIEGSCHSMATVLLLAAPFEQRTANRNSRALIHQVYGGLNGYVNADQLRAEAEDIEREQNAILDIYAERTGKDKQVLEALMKEEKFRTVDELLEYGFISKINSYNTNSKTKKMTGKDIFDKLNALGEKIDNAFKKQPVNKDFKDVEGNTLFTSDAETLEVGTDVQGADGVYTLEDGTIVTIEANKVTAIETPAQEDEEMTALKAENEALKAELESLKNKATENEALVNSQNELLEGVKAELTNLKSQVQSLETIGEPVNKAPKVEENKNQEIINKFHEKMGVKK
jgi:ATP-dependent Clp endopeptidase proteolytic subunit ClpP